MEKRILLIVFISLSVLSINPVNARTNNDQQIIYLPIIAGGNQPIPDPRFGINNLSANDVNALGFTGDRYIQQWNADYLNEKITAHVLWKWSHILGIKEPTICLQTKWHAGIGRRVLLSKI